MPSNAGSILSPVALLSMADKFREAAEKLQGSQDAVPEFFPATHYLLGHGIELALKAYLCAESVPEQDLRNAALFGHDLASCLDGATSRGLSTHVVLDPAEVTAIRLLNEVYETKQLEYSNRTTAAGSIMTVPSTAPLRAAARKLCVGLRAHCFARLQAMRS